MLWLLAIYLPCGYQTRVAHAAIPLLLLRLVNWKQIVCLTTSFLWVSCHHEMPHSLILSDFRWGVVPWKALSHDGGLKSLPPLTSFLLAFLLPICQCELNFQKQAALLCETSFLLSRREPFQLGGGNSAQLISRILRCPLGEQVKVTTKQEGGGR